MGSTAWSRFQFFERSGRLTTPFSLSVPSTFLVSGYPWRNTSEPFRVRPMRSFDSVTPLALRSFLAGSAVCVLRPRHWRGSDLVQQGGDSKRTCYRGYCLSVEVKLFAGECNAFICNQKPCLKGFFSNPAFAFFSSSNFAIVTATRRRKSAQIPCIDRASRQPRDTWRGLSGPDVGERGLAGRDQLVSRRRM